MKKLMFLILLISSTGLVSAQILTPVRWSYAAKRLSDKEAVIFIKASIDQGWHVYSQNVQKGGPVKTTITFVPSKSFLLNGKPTEPTPVTKFEKVFNMEISFFADEVIFQQKITLKSKGPVKVKGNIHYMTCNDEKCLPPDDAGFTVIVN
ncbi:sugar transporter [Mucilaginibacter rubeus]|uniref:Sugar transporter n=1 Tax=Mucilaginibacter rubeus TaxID=2027860 RepID=A0AAE6JK80_9SPHI|nr:MULTISPECIES: protein-disulfide reductase DsbD domain-containing protein [Mucilaginibacter]QEM07151.1 sugar transporter [Mucilaginibacter rubeus]QEM19606.1 sugar transporter [Mucilaginibacter gossypii]QTE43704.1 sugar transporter [Mucilaginibacter rubeus]QTE50304.1 sugar transporter [Mucilaginibacter rubeus]QTE55391.1 sugar transporter [Mucilaginibacter rubeus]